MIANAQELRAFIQQELDRGTLGVLVRQLQAFKAPTFTVATLPPGDVGGQIVFVSDGGAGSRFRGWDGSAWVNLG